MRAALLGVALAVVGATAACAPADATSGARTVEIDIRYSSFQPERVEVGPGETIVFVLRNADPIDHEFIVGDEEVQRVHEEGTEAHHTSRPGEVSVPAGATVSTTYTFAAGSAPLIFGCHLPGHYGYGMRGTIEVG